MHRPETLELDKVDVKPSVNKGFDPERRRATVQDHEATQTHTAQGPTLPFMVGRPTLYPQLRLVSEGSQGI